MYQVTLFASLVLLASWSCSRLPKVLDSQSAILGNDLTALMSCNQAQVSVGWLVCREIEGTSAESEYLFVHAPPQVQCENEKACVYFKIFFPDGRPTYEGNVKKGESYAKVPLSQIIDSNTFDQTTRGVYAVSVSMNYLTSDGVERKTFADGYLIVHLVKKNYTSLLENPEAEEFAWTWSVKNRFNRLTQIIKMTTGFRVYVSTQETSPCELHDFSKL